MTSINMINWVVVNNKLAWNKHLAKNSESNYLQMWEWGEYKCARWRPIRSIGLHNDEVVLIAQMLVKYYPFGIGIVWIPGGVVGGTELWAEDFLEVVKELTGLKHVLIKINNLHKLSEKDELLMIDGGWSRPVNSLSTGMSLKLNIDKPEDILKSDLTKNWRHNLNRSGNYQLRFEVLKSPNAKEIRLLYREMEKNKDLSIQFSLEEIKSLIDVMQNNLLILHCFSSSNKLVAVRACIVFNGTAWDIMAVTGLEARKKYASYGLLWKLIQECRSKNIKYYELGGVDPVKNKGVWNFKKGTGASPIQYLGEWEKENSFFLKKSIDLILKFGY